MTMLIIFILSQIVLCTLNIALTVLAYYISLHFFSFILQKLYFMQTSLIIPITATYSFFFLFFCPLVFLVFLFYNFINTLFS